MLFLFYFLVGFFFNVLFWVLLWRVVEIRIVSRGWKERIFEWVVMFNFKEGL